MDVILGVDVGTTHIKVGAFSLEGELYALEICRTKSVAQGVGRIVYEPQDVWNDVATLIRSTIGQLPTNHKLHSISVASMGEAGLLMDKSGTPLTPIISWFDVRGQEVMDEWYDRFSPADCFRITGLTYHYIYSLLKILWFKNKQPALFEQATKWLCMPDYVYYCLTGESGTDYSIASRTLMFDLKERRWSQTILDLAELDESLLPKAYPSGTIIGLVNKSAADRTSLPMGVPVVAGGHDHICGAFAANVVAPGRVLDSLGTAESLVAAFKELPDLELDQFRGFNIGCHVVPALHYLHGAIDSAGLSVEWFRNQFGDKPDGSRGSYADLISQARSSKPGARGLFFLPHLKGEGPPAKAPASKGSFLGIRDYHTRADFVRAIHEGLCYEMRADLETMEKVLGLEFDKVYAIGGGTKNSLWMEIKSSTINKPVEIPLVQEATLLGAALLGGIGAEVYRDYEDASQNVYKVGEFLQPDSSLRAKYAVSYETYCEILPFARKIGHAIQDDRGVE